MNWTTSKVDPNDKDKKIDKFLLQKVVLGTVRGDQFLCIAFRFDYKFET